MVQTNPYLDRYRKAEGEAISGSLIINHRRHEFEFWSGIDPLPVRIGSRPGIHTLT